VGYNHKSVGQLGSTTIWLEGVSQLAAKAIENHPLFNGQESSTRYIDFTNQPMVYNHACITEWQERWRALYIKALPLTVDMLKQQFPFETNKGHYHYKTSVKEQDIQKITTWENTIKARAFDICRGLLPAGVTTNVAFTGTFDIINDHFGEMLYHPCEEMQDIANQVLDNLAAKYEYAAIPKQKLLERFSYINNDNKHTVSEDFFYQSSDYNSKDFNKLYCLNDGLKFLNLKNRSKFSKIPNNESKPLLQRYVGLLDFGAFRDIHRHRNGTIAMPMLNIDYDINKWYYSNLPKEISDELKELANRFKQWWNLTTLPFVDLQYCVPMGYNVVTDYLCDLNQALYILELRTGKTVHQTLRHFCQDWVKELNKINPNILIHTDMDEDNFTLRRGEQTFNQPV
jgi:hypothetical protein